MTFNKTLLTAALLTVGGFTTISSANAAGTGTGQFDVNMTVTSACTVDATSGANDIAFGSIAAGTAVEDGSISNKESTAGISVKCSTGAPYVINLTSATDSSSTTGTGIMTGKVAGETITYQLNSDSAGETVWGNTGTLGEVGNGVTDTGLGVSTAVIHPIYATVTGSTDVKADIYTDTVNVSVLY